ncbi:hypothetical protein PCASD_02887 [Puccinia coronata f. sp. avenae]|uniref:Myb/SANT-like domain-containing protein n=1 Tax=Puccinia coronata f. sp. avenae TaxID=200324 RepID=A0A2N5VEN4_9BASI|nr:hypothetical protein PCASD_02887 [Puccinia coronata f. sp. avenae]
MIDPNLFNLSSNVPKPAPAPAKQTNSTPTPAKKNHTPTPNTTQKKAPEKSAAMNLPDLPQSTKQVPPAKKDVETSQMGEADGQLPHIWSTIQKCKLLELIIDQHSAGHGTDNGNLKKEGWTEVMNGLNDYFNLNLNREQIKNQKNVI